MFAVPFVRTGKIEYGVSIWPMFYLSYVCPVRIRNRDILVDHRLHKIKDNVTAARLRRQMVLSTRLMASMLNVCIGGADVIMHCCELGRW